MYTQVNEEFAEGCDNYRLLFGRPSHQRVVKARDGYTERANFFVPNSRFALDLWQRNQYGTIHWRCFVCETVKPGEPAETVPLVAPAARVLLRTQGAAESRLFLAWLASLEGEGIDPIHCPAEMFLAADFRLHGMRADTAPVQRLSGRL